MENIWIQSKDILYITGSKEKTNIDNPEIRKLMSHNVLRVEYAIDAYNKFMDIVESPRNSSFVIKKLNSSISLFWSLKSIWFTEDDARFFWLIEYNENEEKIIKLYYNNNLGVLYIKYDKDLILQFNRWEEGLWILNENNFLTFSNLYLASERGFLSSNSHKIKKMTD